MPRCVCRFAIGLSVITVALYVDQSAEAQWGGGQSRWGNILDQPDGFYGSRESLRVAQNVLLYQNGNGGWPKNIDMARRLSDSDKGRLQANRNRSETLIDNGATWTQIRFLALVHAAMGRPADADAQRYADAAQRGLEYLLEAQYDNGGWPMIYPLRKGYYSHITFNDGAMIGVMELLRDVAEARPPFDFVDSGLRARAGQAIDKGLDVILKCQVVVDEKPTVWCAQYDEVTLQPAGARTYELASLSGCESVGIVEYLMKIDQPSPRIRQAIESAVDWFERVKIEGQAVRWERAEGSRRPVDRVVVSDPSAGPLWARFYEIGTNRPMFVGRDGIVHDHLADIERERRLGYSWLGNWPRKLLEEEYPAWRKKWGSE
jgi:PelA/Pel-15E family pectate lyase